MKTARRRNPSYIVYTMIHFFKKLTDSIQHIFKSEKEEKEDDKDFTLMPEDNPDAAGRDGNAGDTPGESADGGAADRISGETADGEGPDDNSTEKKVLEAFDSLGFKMEDVGWGRTFHYEDAAFVYMDPNNDNEYVCIAMPGICEESDYTPEQISALKEEINNKLKYVKASSLIDSVWLSYEHRYVGEENMEDVIAPMILHLMSARDFAHQYIREHFVSDTDNGGSTDTDGGSGVGTDNGGSGAGNENNE